MSCINPSFFDQARDWRGNQIPIPCGVCLNCKRDRISLLEQRAKYEFNNHSSSCFVTFTYDDYHIPVMPGFNRPTLLRRDFEKYIDTVRHSLKKSVIRFLPDVDVNFSFLACGEYGDKFKRPHFHIIFFGLPYKKCKSFLQNYWHFGAIDVRPVNTGAIRYVIKYLSKQQKGNNLDAQYFDNGLEPPFVCHSRSFGAGLFRSQQRNIQEYGVMKFGQKTIGVPAYWKNKFLVLSERNILSIERHRKQYEEFTYITVAKPRGFNSYREWRDRQSQKRERDEYFKRINNRDEVYYSYSFPEDSFLDRIHASHPRVADLVSTLI